MRRVLLSGILVVGAVCAGCDSPTTPTPVPPGPGPVVNNSPPVVEAIRVQGSRRNEPANFADLSEEIEVSATVSDGESQLSSLRFNWSATAGTFTGSGPTVIWRAPAAASTPARVTIALEVAETYMSQGRSLENKVTGSTALTLHNSVQEVSDLSRQFLLDFSDSRLSVAEVMRHFQPGCHGTEAETGDVTLNRSDFTILQWDIGPAATTVNFGGACRFRNKAGDACSRVPVYWLSRAKRDLYDARGRLVMRMGETAVADGVDQLAAVYNRDQRQWRLCDSSFDTNSTTFTGVELRGLVP
jgi:hypothetical protein